MGYDCAYSKIKDLRFCSTNAMTLSELKFRKLWLTIDFHLYFKRYLALCHMGPIMGLSYRRPTCGLVWSALATYSAVLWRMWQYCGGFDVFECIMQISYNTYLVNTEYWEKPPKSYTLKLNLAIGTLWLGGNVHAPVAPVGPLLQVPTIGIPAFFVNLSQSPKMLIRGGTIIVSVATRQLPLWFICLNP